jgi:anti-sigma B factor antagonist
MKLKRKPGSNKTTGLCKLSIVEDMTIYSIEALKQEFSEEIDIYDRFELNLTDVEEIDSSGVQLLLALRAELAKRNKKFKLTGLSGVVAKIIDRYDIGDGFILGEVA